MRPRRTLGTALAFGLLCAPALAAPVQTTLRVEGGSATLIPEVPVTLDDTAGATVTVSDPASGNSVNVPANSATALLANASSQFGVSVGFTVDPQFGSYVNRVGTDATPAVWSPEAPSWRLSINGRNSQVGQDSLILKPNDSVVWAFTNNFAARELQLTISGDRFKQGAPFTATVTSTDPTTPEGQPLVASPAAGATVTYGGQTQTANAKGEVTFRAVGVGVTQVAATRGSDIRSPARTVCSYTTDPTVCSLPPVPAAPQPPTTPTPAPTLPAALNADRVAPGSEIRFPISGRKYTRVNLLHGSAGPDRSDIKEVEVAVTRRIGTRCRFLNRRNVFGNTRPCNKPVFLKAKSSGTRWMIGRKQPFVPGKYLMMSRAIDGSGNREHRTLNTINTVSFTVLTKAEAAMAAKRAKAIAAAKAAKAKTAAARRK